MLVVVRFLFGMGEAGAYPNITRALHNWFPVAERGFAQGAVWMCGRLMGGLTPLVWMVLVEGIGRPLGRAGGADSRPLLPPLVSLAGGLLGVCRRGRGLVRAVRPLVPQPAGGETRRQSRPSWS